jgi:aliphatic sulfonates family ABC transporter substrate-binding protein
MNKRTFLAGAASAAAALYAGGVPAPAPAAPETPKELHVGYQKIGALLIVKDQGLLEKRLAAQGTAVRWVQFQSGPPLIEALNAGAIDFGYTGDTPPIFAQASGVSFVYVASMPVVGKSNAILVRGNSGIKTIADLRGKKVAFVKGSSAHNVVVQTLAKAHLAYSDITPVYLQPADAAAAIQSGAVDAWSIWDPFYAVAERYPGVTLLTNAEGIAPTNSFFLATREYAARYPSTISAVVDEAQRGWRWAEKHQDKLAQVLADASGVDLAAEKVVASRSDYEVSYITSGVVRQQQAIADTFSKLGLIPRSIQISDVVWSPNGKSLSATGAQH